MLICLQWMTNFSDLLVNCLQLTAVQFISSCAMYEQHMENQLICRDLSCRKRRSRLKCHKSVTYTFLAFNLGLHSSNPIWHSQHLKDSPVPTVVRILWMIDLKSMYLGDGLGFFSTENFPCQGLRKSVSSLSHRL